MAVVETGVEGAYFLAFLVHHADEEVGIILVVVFLEPLLGV